VRDLKVLTQIGNSTEVQNQQIREQNILYAEGYKRVNCNLPPRVPGYPVVWVIIYERQVPTLREAVKEFVDELHLSPKALQKHLIAIHDAYDREGEET